MLVVIVTASFVMITPVVIARVAVMAIRSDDATRGCQHESRDHTALNQSIECFHD
jgi:hypothetical protein